MAAAQRTSWTLNNGVKTPVLGLGVYLIDPKETAITVERALEIGYRLIDTASCYYNEKETVEGIANFLKKNPSVKRDEILYTTKVWDEDHGYDKCKKSIEKQVQIAKDGGIGHIDILLVHSPFGGKEDRYETWRAMEESLDTGNVKTIGVSNFGVAHLKEMLATCKVPPAINQLELSPWLQRADIIAFCNEHGIVPEAYAPLTQGNKLQDAGLLAMCAKYNKTPGQILIKWSLQKGFLPLPKSTKVERLQENFDNAAKEGEAGYFKLSDEDLEALGDKNAYEHFDWDPTNCP